MDCGNVTRVRWSDVRSRVVELSSKLASAIDAVTAELPNQLLFRVSYPYGTRIAVGGRLAPPCNQSAAEGECACCSDLQTSIDRSAFVSALPVSLLLDNYAEVYAEHGDKEKRIIPLNLFRPGDLFGVFESSDRLIERLPWSPWHVSAGARSVRILANLTSDKHKGEIDRALDTQEAKATRGDWALIAHFSRVKSPWKTTILALPAAWFNQPNSGALKQFVLTVAWEQSEGLRKQAFEHFVTPRVVVPITDVDSQYYRATLQHLVAVAEGGMPAFAPVVRGRYEAGPFLAFQEFIIKNDIGVKIQKSQVYFPALLQPTLLKESRDIGYYSITCPTLLYPIQGDPVPRAKKDFLRGVQRGLKDFLLERDQLDYYKTRFIALDDRGRPEENTVEARRMLEVIEGDFPPSVSSSRPLPLSNLFLRRAVRVVRR